MQRPSLLIFFTAFLFAACGGEDENADPDATPTPEPKPPEELVEELIQKRLPLGWSIKTMDLKPPVGNLEITIVSPYDFEFEKKAPHARETGVLRLCPRAFELSAIDLQGLKLTLTITGANRQNFPVMTCP